MVYLVSGVCFVSIYVFLVGFPERVLVICRQKLFMIGHQMMWRRCENEVRRNKKCSIAWSVSNEFDGGGRLMMLPSGGVRE